MLGNNAKERHLRFGWELKEYMEGLNPVEAIISKLMETFFDITFSPPLRVEKIPLIHR